MQKPLDSNWGQPKPRTPAPQIDPVFLWPTPDERDFLFFVERNGDLPVNQKWEYGSPYPDRIKYPNHKLVYVAPQTVDKWSRWYYASNRLDQDEYNWSYSEADIGGTRFAAVSRIYYTFREDWSQATPAMGEAMPDVPKDKFAGTFVLAERQQIAVDDQTLTSLFVFEKRTYVQKTTLVDNGYDPKLEGNLSTSTTLYYRGETISGTPIEDLVADEANTYWGLQDDLIARSGKQLTTNWFAVTEQRVSMRVSTGGEYEPGWPVEQLKSTGSEANVPALFADQVSSVITTTTEDLDAADTEDIPDPAAPTGTEAYINHKKVSDRHYKKTIGEQIFTLSPDLLAVDVEVKPYVKITTYSRGGLTSELPLTGSGSSQLVWKAGEQKLYDNRDIDSVGIPGLKGFEDKDQVWGSYVERFDYSEDYDAPPGGSSQIIYKDGETTMYEVSSIDSVTAAGTTKDKDPQQWGSLTWNGTYDLSENLTADRTRQVWRKGDYKVYLNETVSVDVSGTTLDKDPQQWGTLTWNGLYETTQDVDADRTRQVWRLGSNTVFLNETASISVSGTTLDKDPQQWGTVTWSGAYETTQDVDADRTRQVWRLGSNTVFLNETVSVDVSGTTLDKDPQQWGTLTWSGSYSTTQDVDADRTRQVWRMGSNTVFLNETAALSISGGTKDVDPQRWGSLEWNGTYASGSSGTKSRQVFRLGSSSVYLNESPTLNISGGSFTSSRQTTPLFTEEETLTYSDAADGSSPNSRSTVIFALGADRVFENISLSVTPGSPRTYGTVVRFSTPAILTAIIPIAFGLRNGDSETYYQPIIEEGVDGYFPATVNEYYTENPTGPSSPIITFRPTPVSFVTPFGGLKVPPTLHGDLSFDVTTGTRSRRYVYTVQNISIPPTNFVTWVGAGDILVAYQTTPYKTGYIVQEVTVQL